MAVDRLEAGYVAENRERSERSAFDAARGDRDRTLVAIHGLESALSRASTGEDWIGRLSSTLEALEKAMAEEQQELARPDSLLTMVSAQHPRRFGPRVRGIREQYEDILRQLASFQREVDGLQDSAGDASDLRQRAGCIIRALHNCRNRQTDLVFDALRLDLGGRPDD